jgi:hypothetical protein
MAVNPQRAKVTRAQNRGGVSTGLFAIVLGVVIVLCAAWALSDYRNNTASVDSTVTTGAGEGNAKTHLNSAPLSSTSPRIPAPPSSTPVEPTAR